MTPLPAERVEAVVIGGGVIGCALLRELAQSGIHALLMEAEPSVCEGTSKANSAIVHTGFDAHPGTVEATMLRRSAELWPSIIDELSIPYLAVGALMLARDREEAHRLEAIAHDASELGVATELLRRNALRQIAPYVTDGAEAALSVPEESVIDPFWLVRRYAEAAIAAGAEVWTDTPVAAISLGSDAATVRVEDGRSVVADQVFNCAGLWADEVAALVADASFSLTPRAGQFLVSEETFGVDRIVLPIPGPMGKGMLVTPIVFGGLLLGPTAEERRDKQDRSVDAQGRARIMEFCRGMVPSVAEMRPIRQFTGLRAVSSTGDYILGPSPASDRLYHVTGIRSTGISASPAVAEYVAAEARRLRGWRRRASAARVSEVSLEEPAGEMVCPCRSVSHGEIVGSIHHVIGSATIDAAKRASGVTFGDCQGNLCAVSVTRILSAASGSSPSDVLKHRRGSWVLAPGSGSTAVSRAVIELPADEELDAVVIGGGLAGIGAALALADANQRVAIIERRQRSGGALAARPSSLSGEERRALRALDDRVMHGSIQLVLGATASGLVADGGRWSIQVQTQSDAWELGSPSVVLACGGYVEPREHLAIAGPRPSGVITADLVEAALDAGWLPGHRAVVLGRGRTAANAVDRLREAGAGVEWVTSDDPAIVEAVLGDRRVERVCISGAWVDADTLVMAHRLLPAAFLARPLGLVDARPGIPIPSDPDGRTELDGLWVAGTCRAPDVDHRLSLADGRHVAGALSAAQVVAP